MTPETLRVREWSQILHSLARDVVAASRVPPEGVVGLEGANTTRGPIVRPGGGEAYAAYWIRDFTLSLDCGLITPEELEHAVVLASTCQADEDFTTPSGSRIPRGSIPDHITLAGSPIFFPGTNDPAQQGKPYGDLPSLDNSSFFVEMVWHYVQGQARKGLLWKEIAGLPLLQRLDRAFEAIPADAETGLVWCDEHHRGVSWGFTDIVVHSGFLLFASLLRQRAARRLSSLHGMVGDDEGCRRYQGIAEVMSNNIFPTFVDPRGLLRASTGRSSQVDVWGSAFSVATLALRDDNASVVATALSRALQAGTISWQGNIRHIPTDADYGDGRAWESIVGEYPLNAYQNGAYWGTPTGWVCAAVAQVDERAALALAAEYIGELIAGDFRKGNSCGSPYECIHPDGEYRRNPIYMTSITVPLAEFMRLGWVERGTPRT